MFRTEANEIDATVNRHDINKTISDTDPTTMMFPMTMMTSATIEQQQQPPHCQTVTDELSASVSVAVHVEEDENFCRQNQQQTIDENYVFDISMMKIDDKQAGGATTLHLEEEEDDDDANGNNEINVDVDVDADALNADEGDVVVAGIDSNGNAMPSEVMFDRQMEEQTITELVHASNEMQLMEAANNGRMRVVFGILVRLVLPLAHGVARSFKGIRDARLLRALRNLAASRQALTNLVAFAANTISLNLSSVQVTNRIGPLLQILKLRKSRDGLESLPDTLSVSGGVDGSISTPSTPSTPIVSPTMSPFLREARGSLPMLSTKAKRKSTVSDALAPNCCTLNILAEPPAGVPIRADIIFIHGLHGSLVNTWKQGLWENERHPVEFERPPRPPVRPPKRPRHSRTSTVHQPPQQKRARFAQKERQWSEPDLHVGDNDFECQTQTASFADYSYVCGEPEDIQICEGIEYSFPTFRLRMNEQSRLFQGDLATILNNENANTTNKQNKRKKSVKPSPDDPNYSKCWPGDWLPIDCPGVRVIAVNYTTDQYLWRPLWKRKEPRSSLMQRSREMAEQLIKHRVGYGHPIVYVGHSKGGLFIKQIIVDAWESGRPAMSPLWRSARGVFFYSVPHRGSHLASIKAPLLSRSVELLEIEKNNKYLLDLHKRFAGLYDLGHLKIEVFSFVETALTLMSVLYLRIVGVDSADPGIGDVCGIRLDHREICKPRSRDCILYKELVKMIKKVC